LTEDGPQQLDVFQQIGFSDSQLRRASMSASKRKPLRILGFNAHTLIIKRPTTYLVSVVLALAVIVILIVSDNAIA
jgi:hypothetical protein